MSWDIDLIDTETGESVEEFNITWNYSPYYYEHLDSEKGIRAIYEVSIDEAIRLLTSAIQGIATSGMDITNKDPEFALGTKNWKWNPTPFHAIEPLNNLLLAALKYKWLGYELHFEGD